MAERDWMVDIEFFQQVSGLEFDFFKQYMETAQNFGLAQVTHLTMIYRAGSAAGK